jgi:hypothetical protein
MYIRSLLVGKDVFKFIRNRMNRTLFATKEAKKTFEAREIPRKDSFTLTTTHSPPIPHSSQISHSLFVEIAQFAHGVDCRCRSHPKLL